MHIGGTLLTAVVRIAVLAATLALVYYFVIRPVLETTETVSSGITTNIQDSLDQANEAFDDTGLKFNQARISKRIRAMNTSQQARFARCTQKVNQLDPSRRIAGLNRCLDRFDPAGANQ
jgi:F0F1-type ATP synthase membrane subunit b/b'